MRFLASFTSLRNPSGWFGAIAITSSTDRTKVITGSRGGKWKKEKGKWGKRPLLFPPSVLLSVFKSFHVAPIGADLCFCDERDAQLVRSLHHFLDELRERRNLFFGRLEKQFVVNLQNHSRLEFAGEAPVELDHRELDEVGGCALHGRIHCGALGKIAHVRLG